MHSSTASLSSKLLSVFFAVTLALGLVPAAAFAAEDSSAPAADDSLSLIPEGDEDAASIASSAKGGSDDVFSHCPSDAASSADGGSVATSSEDVSNNESISEDVTLDTVVAQAETTKSFFLAQTLESTRTIPMVSASLPMEVSQNASATGGDDGVSSEGISSASTVIGSFEYLGMTFAIESDGASVALVAADYSKLPQEFIEKQVVVIPESVTPDGIDNYSVTRIADNVFAGFTKENANPDFVGCESLFSDGELLAEAGIDPSDVQRFLTDESSEAEDSADSGMISNTVSLSDADGSETDNVIRTIVSMDGDVATLDDDSTYVFTNPLAGCTGILALGIPASVTIIEDDAFVGFGTLQYLVAAGDNLDYASYDGALYDVDLANLRFIPEGRMGVLLIPANLHVEDLGLRAYYSMLDTNGVNDVLAAENREQSEEQNSYMSTFDRLEGIFLPLLSTVSQSPLLEPHIVEPFSGRDCFSSSASDGIYYVTAADASASLVLESSSTIVAWLDTNISNNGLKLWINGHASYSPKYDALISSWRVGAIVYCSETGQAGSFSALNLSGRMSNNTRSFYAVLPSYRPLYLAQSAGHYASPSTFEIEWIAVDGSPSHMSNEVESGAVAIAPEDERTSRIGYKLEGWYPNEDLSGDRVAPGGSTPSITADTTYYAKWTPVSYSVVLDAKGGSIGSTNVGRTYDDGVALPAPTAPPGFTFSKWTTNSDGSGTSYAGGSTANLTTIDDDTVRLYAQYTGDPITLTFDPHDGSAAVADTQTCGQPLSLPTLSSRIGWDFQGWFTAAEGGTQVTSADKVPAEPTTYHAQWKQREYPVVFEAGDGAFDPSWSQPSGTFAYVDGTITAPNKGQMTRRGYTLSGWSTSQAPANTDTVATGAGSIAEGGTTNVASLYAGSSSIPPEIKLYPVWSVNTYEVTIASDDGAYDDAVLRAALAKDPSGKANLVGSVVTYTVLTPAFAIPSAKRTGWSFGGWSKDGTSSANPSVSIDPAITLENATYTALWSKNSYLIKYYEDAGKDKEASFASGATAVSSFDVDGPASMVLPTPSRTGWDFLGWSGPGIASDGKTVDLKALITDDLPKFPAIALVYTASWERGAYTVTYVLNDEDDNYLGSFAESYEGFNGTAPDRQDARTYIDTYRFDESGTAPVLELPSKTNGSFELTRPGYVFAGWVKEGTEVPVTQIDPNVQAEDIVLEARWTPVSSLVVPIATTPETVDVVLDRATGRSQEDIEGAPKSLEVHSTTPVDCTLSLRSSKGDADLHELFETMEGAPASALDDVASSLGLLLSFDGTGLAGTAPAPVGFLPDAASDPVAVVRVQGSEQYAADSPYDLCSVDVGTSLKLAQRQADGTFEDLAIDLTKVRIKDISDPVRFASLVWTVSL